jgi:hypothetical protein
MQKVNMRRFVLGLTCLFTLLGASPGTQLARLKVETKQCGWGLIIHPAHASISIFDVSSVPQVMKLAKEFEDSENPSNGDDAGKMLDLYSRLEALVDGTPALARSTRLAGSQHVFSIPQVPRVVVFGFGDDESALTSYAKREVDIAPGQLNIVELNFSAEEDCKGAKEAATQRPPRR